jgi:transcriptional regulator with GAF, ATPase, and Fis domain
MAAKVVVLAGPLCGEAFSIEAAETTIGRDAAVQLSIPDHLMSRRHCTVELAGDRFTLRDLGSSNGTFVNGMPVRERVLEHGDRIRAGQSVLLFLGEPSASGAERPTAVDDRTTRLPQVKDAAGAASSLDSPQTIVSEVFAGRMTLPMHDMVGESAAMCAIYDRIRRAAPADCTVLICGETGTGKELAARAIHENSPRARGPFVAVNCAALTESLLESELLGHERGAFTGAVALKKGKLEVADGGTIFLDEIGELAPSLQAKLLRALQYHEFERVGGTRTIKVNVRVVAATNRDLGEAVAQGGFRQDLWYRLNVLALTMPPLRARRTDIPMLAAHFARKYGRGRPVELSREALDALTAYDWPGNVRELENAIESAVVLGSSNLVVADDLPPAILDGTGGPRKDPAAYHQSVLEAKRKVILDAIDRSAGNYTAAAKLLGINPTYLHRLVKNLQLKDTTVRR